MMKLRFKLALRSRMRRLLGRGSAVYAMELHCLSEHTIRRLIEGAHARVLDVRCTNSVEPSFNGDLQYLNQEPLQGLVSKQYCVVKNS